jgi:hypothetical protein
MTGKKMPSPEKKFVAGAISATVWNNEKSIGTNTVEMTSVSLARNYKDKDGKWKSVSSLRLNDLPKAKLVLDKAYEYLTMKETA